MLAGATLWYDIEERALDLQSCRPVIWRRDMTASEGINESAHVNDRDDLSMTYII